MPRRNEEVAAVLETIAELLALKHDRRVRVRAFYEAGRTISAMPADIDEVRFEGRLQKIPRIGRSIAAKIEEYLTTGRLAYYEDLRRQLASPPAQPAVEGVRASLPEAPKETNPPKAA